MLLARSNPEEIRVLLVDATKMACQLLSDAISQEQQISVVAAVTNASEAVKTVTELSPNIALISGHLDSEPMRGFELARELQTLNPQLAVVMLLDSSNSASIVEAFRAGACGVFTRDGSLESLRNCIFTVVRGQVWMSTEELRFVLEALSQGSNLLIVPENLADLTNREREVVRLAADGVKNRQIAQRLGISQHTVKNYLFSIFKKLGISSRVELALAFKQSRSATVPVAVNSAAPSEGSDILQWLQALAERGSPSAQLLLAEIYCEGRAVSRDHSSIEESLRISESHRGRGKKLVATPVPLQMSETEGKAAAWLQHIEKQSRRKFSRLSKSGDSVTPARRRRA